MNIEQARFNMIEQQIRPWDVLDPAVLSLLALVRREDFVPAAYRGLAFMDLELPLGGSGAADQVMLPPRVEARLLQDAQVQRHEKVLEIGAGSGFMAALLGHRAQSVVTLEIDPALARRAADNLRRASIGNVVVREGDGSQGLAAEGPFDVIILSGSVAAVPQALLDQLKPGGRLMAIVGQEPAMQAQRITRQSANALHTETLFETVAPRLRHFPEASRFSF